MLCQVLNLLSSHPLMTMNPSHSMKPCSALQRRKLFGTRLLSMKSKLSLTMGRLSLSSFPLVEEQLEVDGFSRSSAILMAPLTDTRQELLLKALHNALGFTTLKPSPLHQSGLLFVLF